MFYEETMIDGLWWWRGIPNGKWTAFTPAQYVAKIAKMEQEHDKLRARALGVANAIHVGTAMMIRGTMMEDEFREALGLEDGELWNFTIGAAEMSEFRQRSRATGEKS